MSTRTRQDWTLWAQLGCALVITAHAEYTLAVATSVHWVVALAFPGALDLYVIRALQKHRDVLPAVLVMVGAVVSSHLVAAGMLPVGWVLVSAVGALAPLLVWRGHVLRVHAGAVSAPVPEAVPAWAPGYHLDGCDGVHEHEGPVNCAARAHVLEAIRAVPAVPADRCDLCAQDRSECGHLPRTQYGAPDRVPDWMTDEYPVSAPDVVHPSTAEQDEYADKWERVHAPVPYLHAVPDLPAEFNPASAAHSAPDPVVLRPGDREYIALAQEYIATTDAPSVRGLKAYASIGQEKATRLLRHLGVKP